VVAGRRASVVGTLPAGVEELVEIGLGVELAAPHEGEDLSSVARCGREPVRLGQAEMFDTMNVGVVSRLALGQRDGGVKVVSVPESDPLLVPGAVVRIGPEDAPDGAPLRFV
jgi:hypothetical protein